MKAVIQRVLKASVIADGLPAGSIDQGFLILLGVDIEDAERDADVLADKISVLRVFSDKKGKMNLSISDIGGRVLVISNFTLCADCRKGRRPNFINAADPAKANNLYEYFCSRIISNGIPLEKGVFGADMQVSLVNDGPITIVLNSEELIK